jgi:Ribosomal protein L6P/L9E
MTTKSKRKKIHDEIEIHSDITIELSGDKLKLKKDKHEVDVGLQYPAKIEGKTLIFDCERPTKREKKLIKSTMAHIKNAVNGLGEKYVYRMQVCFVHFPMNIVIKGNEIVIKNFLGEVKDRKAKILDNVIVKLDKEIITVESPDKNKAGQTAANIEQATRINKRDRRIFQDGIYILEKQKGAKR